MIRRDDINCFMRVFSGSKQGMFDSIFMYCVLIRFLILVRLRNGGTSHVSGSVLLIKCSHQLLNVTTPFCAVPPFPMLSDYFAAFRAARTFEHDKLHNVAVDPQSQGTLPFSRTVLEAREHQIDVEPRR